MYVYIYSSVCRYMPFYVFPFSLLLSLMNIHINFLNIKGPTILTVFWIVINEDNLKLIRFGFLNIRILIKHELNRKKQVKREELLAFGHTEMKISRALNKDNLIIPKFF